MARCGKTWLLDWFKGGLCMVMGAWLSIWIWMVMGGLTWPSVVIFA